MLCTVYALGFLLSHCLFVFCSILKESRWKSSLENLESQPGVMEIDGLVFNIKRKIADGAQVFLGLFSNCPVAVKRVLKDISEKELKIANLLCSEKFKTKHLLQPLTVLEDTHFAYFVFPLCEYSLKDLIENKDFPERLNLTDQWRLGICQELLLGLQELHAHAILHSDLKPENILFGKGNCTVNLLINVDKQSKFIF